jgi:hypothetical protein
MILYTLYFSLHDVQRIIFYNLFRMLFPGQSIITEAKKFSFCRITYTFLIIIILGHTITIIHAPKFQVLEPPTK